MCASDLLIYAIGKLVCCSVSVIGEYTLLYNKMKEETIYLYTMLPGYPVISHCLRL